MQADTTTDVLGMIVVDSKDEEPTCKEDICVGCSVLGDCDDTKKHIRNALRKRLRGNYTHEQLLHVYNVRFGPVKKKAHHWKDIIGQLKPIYIELANMNTLKRIKYMAELGIKQAKMLEMVDGVLARNGWVRPYIEKDELHFHKAVTIPINEKEIKPVKFIDKKINVEEDFISEVEPLELTQGELEGL